MTLEQINELIDEEVEKRLCEKITKIVEFVSKRYSIDKRLLIQDIERMDELPESPREEHAYQNGLCRGFNRNGKRCTFKGKHGGFCSRHISQKKESRPTINVKPIEPTLTHNHSFSDCLYKLGCPACEKNKKPETKKKSLIDL